MCALAKGNLMPGASSRLEAESPNDAGRYDGRGEDRGSPAELWRATRLSRLARPVSNNVTSLLFYTRYRGTPPKTRNHGKRADGAYHCSHDHAEAPTRSAGAV